MAALQAARQETAPALPEIDTTTALGAKDALIARLERNATLIVERDAPKGAVKGADVRTALVKALKAYKRGDYKAAVLRALEATRLDPKAAQAYHTLALALEGLGELHKALVMYERAMQLDPKDPEVYLNLGLVAWKLHMLEGAEKFFRLYVALNADSPLGYNNLGGVLRDQTRFNDAIEILRGAIYRFPDKAELWNTLGTVAMEQGSIAEAQIFYQEALRLEPRSARTYHNIANALSSTGELDDAVRYYDKALKLMDGHGGEQPDAIEARHGRALCLIGLGNLKEGIAEWEVRHDPHFRGSMLYAIKQPRWQGEPLAGKRILVMGELGLSDELLFSNVFPDLISALGPDGKLLVAADSRLIPLFQRSFPDAEIGPYDNKCHSGKGVRCVPWLAERAAIDYFSPCGSALRFLRTDIASFPTDKPHLKPDLERVAFWRERLEALGPRPYVGISWRGAAADVTRANHIGSLDEWAPVLRTEHVRFINLQYGDCTDDLARMRKRFGTDIHAFADLDLMHALDDSAALCAALDLVVSAPAQAAAGALAGAVGTEVWLLTGGKVWPALGTDRFPWLVKSRVFRPKRHADFPELMARLAKDLAAFVQSRRETP
jgi:tetratricopeptide (TPR) repeat protein